MRPEKTRAYVSVSYGEKHSLRSELNAITVTLAKFKIECFIFVDQYSFARDQEQEMMSQAMKDIDGCDFLISETSHKAIGIGVEVGYGKAKNKPIVYLRRNDAEHSTTVSGISDFHIIYYSILDLQAKLESVVAKVIATR
ncbi:MAG TPA: hypothetical protein VL728_05890 [Cyclobacteriaceae bacterium]|jgi:hypothetical protein|nr:hypothetical protein [Cyclobacteriaceae bacterium]